MIPLSVLSLAWLAAILVWVESEPISPKWEAATFGTALVGLFGLYWAWTVA